MVKDRWGGGFGDVLFIAKVALMITLTQQILYPHLTAEEWTEQEARCHLILNDAGHEH